jgi:hypothetical protein
VDWGELDEMGTSKPGEAAFFHSLPMCADFNRLSADDFMRAVLDGKHRN